MKLFKTIFLFVLFVAVSLNQSNEVCEDCHDDESLATTKYGLSHSLYITSDNLVDTPHEDFSCTDCHQDLEDFDDFPHPEYLKLPDCGSCHEDAQDAFVDGFFQPLIDKGYTSIPSCADCHGKHKITWKGQPRKVCGVCHQDVLDEFLHSAHWNGEDEEAEVTCVSCHDPHFKHEKDSFSEPEWKIHVTESCSECHKDQVENYTQSGHYKQVKSGNMDAPICSDCHAKHQVLSPRDSQSKVSVAKMDMICTECHLGYEASIHRPEINDDPRLETCVVCHTGHETEMGGNTVSSVFNVKLGDVCIRCHTGNLITGENDAHGGIHRDEIERIEQTGEARCGSCHDYHFMAIDHNQLTSLEKSCGDCHEKEQLEYEKSSHYIAWSKGHEEEPTCNTCHDNQRIKKSNETFVGQSVVSLCSSCHGDRDMTLKFQLNPEVVDGYQTSYHGQMYQLGYLGEEFATCISCHDNHSILPSDHTESSVGQERIIETCAQCHENVNMNFVKYLQHYTPHTKEQNVVLKWIHTFMVWLLGVTLTVFGGHTLLWLIRLLIIRYNEGEVQKPVKSPMRYQRFTMTQRIMHFFMAGGFLVLAGTGLPLKYAHSELANWFVHNIVGFQAAAILHRVAAVTLFIVMGVHLGILFYEALLKQRKGLFWGPDSLVPNMQDIKDFFNHIAYFIGARKNPPQFGRWTYWEKFDYFAVFWGMIVIGASGVMLWFPEVFSRFLPGWVINAAHIIHSEEALLATAFIFTVHFFNTHLRPDAFPMDEAIFTGRVSEERFAHERSLEKDALKDDEYKNRLVHPLKRWQKKGLLIIGTLFLFFGLFLLVLILLGTFS